jgi:hypothetical protein
MRYKLRLVMQYLSRSFLHRSRRASVAALLALAVLGLLAQSSVPDHLHINNDPGIYNAECPLAASEAVHRGAPLPEMSFGDWVPHVVLRLVVSPATHKPDSPLRLAASRAPPLA